MRTNTIKCESNSINHRDTEDTEEKSTEKKSVM
jgi:hypothetical protein